MRARLTRNLSSWLAALAVASPAAAVTVDWANVNAPGNTCDPQPQGCFGAVAVGFRIAKHEVTNKDYAEFLTAVASEAAIPNGADPNGLYSAEMGSSAHGGITRTGDGILEDYVYRVKQGFADKPVNFVTFWDAARFANWLNNQQLVPPSNDTETGAYTITTAGMNNNTITRNSGAQIYLPSEAEWYKAAYLDPSTYDYFTYPTRSDAAVTCSVPSAATGRANCDSAVGTVTDVGAYTGSPGPFGTFDQGGNVSEWNDTIINGNDYRGARAGSWLNPSASDAASVSVAGFPGSDDPNVGFRVAALPEPSTVLGLAASAAMLGVLHRRRRSRALRTSRLRPLVLLGGIVPLLMAAESPVPFTSDPIDPASAGGRTYNVFLPCSDENHEPHTIAFTVFEPARFDSSPGHALVLQGHGFALTRSRFPSGWIPESPAAYGAPVGSLIGDVTGFIEAGFWVISLDQRGHGDSGGKVRLMDPDAEGVDLLQVLDWAEEAGNLKQLLYRDGNLVLGAVGASYGGGYQMMLLAIDPLQRMDAIVPQITWNDIDTALAPNGVNKSGWALALIGASTASTQAGLDPVIYEETLASSQTNRNSPRLRELLRYHGLKYWCDQLTLTGTTDQGRPFRTAVKPPKVDALFYQGMHDMLLPLNQAEANAECLSALGGDVRVYTYQAGHNSPSSFGITSPPPFDSGATCSGPDCFALIQDYLDQYGAGSAGDYTSSSQQLGCGRYGVPEMEVLWMRAKLHQDPAAIAALDAAPQDCRSLGVNYDAISLDGVVAPPPTHAAIPGIPDALNVTLNGVQAQPVGIPLVTVQGPTVLSGTPKATITISPVVSESGVTAPEAGVDDPIIFVALARSRAGYDHYCREYAGEYGDPWGPATRFFCDVPHAATGQVQTPAYFEIIDDQITPLRGYGTHTIDLNAVGERLGEGEQIQLFVFGYHYLFFASGSRNPAELALQLSGSVDLPLLGDLPALTSSLPADGDGDGVDNADDNCPNTYNPAPQADSDGDGAGDACDAPEEPIEPPPPPDGEPLPDYCDPSGNAPDDWRCFSDAPVVGETLFGSGYVTGALGPGADPGSGYGAAGPDSCGATSWVAGVVDLCAGHLIYRDYVYDDYGADTGSWSQRIAAATPSAGDQNYPTGAQNTADLVSLDLSLDGGDVVVAFELNTLYTANQTIAAITIDSDGSAATSTASLLGLTTTGADIAYQWSSGDPATNTITGRFPRPAGTTWKLWAAVAQADGTVMNVAFRGTREQANAGGSQFEPTEAVVFPYVGAFWEDRQAALLAAGDISGASYTVAVADLENAVTRGTAVTPGLHQRVYTSAYTQGAGEGIDPNGIPGRDSAMQPEGFEQFFYYLGKYQPYGLYIPASIDDADPHALFVQLHGANANHASQVNQPGFVQDLGETPQRFIASAMGRGPHGWYSDISERDILDVRADMVANYPVDPDQVVIGGYSMGGYGATRLAAYYPHLFAAAMNWAGFTGSGFNLPIDPALNPLFAIEDAGSFAPAQSGIGAVDNVIDLIQNLRHIPTAIVYGGQDLNTPSHTAVWERFLNGEGPYQFWEYPVAEHFTFIVLDEWAREAEFTQGRVRVADPAHVTYRTNPTHDYNESPDDYDIVHDSAYWVGEIRGRATGYVDIDLTSRGCGGADPVYETGQDAGAGQDELSGVPLAWVSTFRDATDETTPQAADNRLTGSLSNVSSLTVDVDGACLAPGTYYEITTDGPATVSFSDGRSVVFPLLEPHTYTGTL